MPTLTLPNGSRREVPAGTRSRDVAESIGKRLAQAAIAALNGTQVGGRTLNVNEARPKVERGGGGGRDRGGRGGGGGGGRGRY